jgi:hypothetical protein
MPNEGFNAKMESKRYPKQPKLNQKGEPKRAKEPSKTQLRNTAEKVAKKIAKRRKPRCQILEQRRYKLKRYQPKDHSKINDGKT